jgi:Gas vesicle synthesis protein GvpL/GvpF
MKAVYVFAFTGRAIPSFTVDKHRVEFIDLGGVHAAIERLTERPTVSETSLRTQHDIVMRIFDNIDDVVPARFGALIEEGELRDILAARRSLIQDALTLVRGRVQMTVRFREAPESMPARKPFEANGAMSGTAYLEARRSAARTMMPVLAGVVSTAVADMTIAERSEPATERTHAALYHLIDRSGVVRYSDALSRLQSPAISVSGPWPPFAFAPDLWP